MSEDTVYPPHDQDLLQVLPEDPLHEPLLPGQTPPSTGHHQYCQVGTGTAIPTSGSLVGRDVSFSSNTEVKSRN